MAPTIYFFHRLSQFFLSEKASKIATFIFLILTSIPFFEGNIANAEVFMLLPTIVGVLLLVKPKPKFQNLIFSGLLLGLAFTIKIPVAIEFAFLCLWLFIDNLISFKKLSLNIKHILIFCYCLFNPHHFLGSLLLFARRFYSIFKCQSFSKFWLSILLVNRNSNLFCFQRWCCY